MIIQETFERFLTKKKMKNLSSKTIENYVSFVTPFIKFVGDTLDILQLNTDLVLDYVSTLYDRKLSDASRATYIRHIKVFLRWLKDCYGIPIALSELDIPKTGKKLVRILTPEDVKKLFASIKAESEWLTKRNCAILSFMYDSGLRQSEVVALQWKDLYFDQGYAVVCGKGDKERCVPMGSMMCGFILEYMRLCPYKSDYVFVSRRGTPTTSNAIKKLVQKIKVNTGINFSSHKLRHNFATNYCTDSLERTGQCDAYTLQVLLGHENVKTTEKYMHYAKSVIASKNSHSHLDSVLGA